jgi:hypothetical protein
VLIEQIGYLIFLVVHSKSTIPILSIVMLAAIYGLQALVFIFRMRWDMIAWMICEFQSVAWADISLYLGHSCFLILPTIILFLEDG